MKKQSARLILLVLVLWSAHLAKAQQEEDGDVVSADSPEDGRPNGSDSNKNGRIYNGIDAAIANTPYLGMFTVPNKGGDFYFGGAIISNTQILTSASALKRINRIPEMAGVFLAEKDSTVIYSGVLAKSFETHSGFDSGTLANDVAVLTVDGTLAGQNVQPIAIATTEIAVSTTNRTKCVMAGWGQTLADFDGTVDQVEYELMTDQECAAYGTNPPSIMCAKPIKGFGCQLDGGAPLVCNGQLYGILTDQSSCSTSNPPKYQKFAKLPVITIPGNTATQPASNATQPASNATQPISNATQPISNATLPKAPRKNYLSCP
uniref:Putative trypsin n=2 Tax=Anopheles triannulatus TaxID=58253 RepID=A0A2M4ALF3_9DIPT